MKNEKMDRGTDAMKAHLGSTQKMDIRQTRRGWLQECLGCEARSEFKYFIDGNQVAHSLEDSGCCCRFWCSSIHPFQMQVKELQTEAELLTVDRPCALCACSCKCCGYQSATVSSGGQELGVIKETCYWCVPSFQVHDASGEYLYLIHPPTCCGGWCINCCTEGNPCCGKGCCKMPFRVYSAEMDGATNGAKTPYVGKILKKPKSLMTEVFTDAVAFEVEFPDTSTPDQRALLVGSSMLLNSLYFEGVE